MRVEGLGRGGVSADSVLEVVVVCRDVERLCACCATSDVCECVSDLVAGKANVARDPTEADEVHQG